MKTAATSGMRAAAGSPSTGRSADTAADATAPATPDAEPAAGDDVRAAVSATRDAGRRRGADVRAAVSATGNAGRRRGADVRAAVSATGNAGRRRGGGGGARAVLAMAWPYRWRLAGAGLLAAGTELAGLALMATATWLLISAAGRPPLQALTVAIVAVRALAVGRGALRYAERLAGHDAVLRLLTDVRARVYEALASSRGTADGAPVPVIGSGDALSRLVSDVDAVQNVVIRVLVPAGAAATVGALAIAGTALISPAAAGALAAGLLLAGVALPAAAVALTRRTADRVAPLRGALAADAIDLTAGAADLAAYGATAGALRATAARAAELARLERRLAYAGWALDATGVLLAGLTSAAVIVVALRTGVPGVLVGVLAVATLAAVESTLALLTAARHWSESRTALARLAALLSSRPPHSPRPDLAPERSDRDSKIAEGSLAAVGIVVRYRAAGAAALDGIDLTVAPGRRVAVVGASGAGKSTLIGVLAGLIEPTAGTVTHAGRPLHEYPAETRPRVVGGLLAEAYVFQATVRENLLLGRPGSTEGEIGEACSAAGLLDWVRAQPRGWDTLVGADGAQLSGGQRQRLALARALLARPAVLVLDEPTEGLHPAAADRVLASALAAAGPDRAVVLVTHRLRGLDEFDEIVVLDAGRVTQRGTHAELVSAPGWYRDQWLAQENAERGYLALSPARG